MRAGGGNGVLEEAVRDWTKMDRELRAPCVGGLCVELGEVPDLLLGLVVGIRGLERCCLVFFVVFQDIPHVVRKRFLIVGFYDSVDDVDRVVGYLVDESPTATASLIVIFRPDESLHRKLIEVFVEFPLGARVAAHSLGNRRVQRVDPLRASLVFGFDDRERRRNVCECLLSSEVVVERVENLVRLDRFGSPAGVVLSDRRFSVHPRVFAGFFEDLEPLANVTPLLGGECRSEWDHVVAQDAIAEREVGIIPENVTEFVGIVRSELDLPLTERAFDLGLQRVDELQVVRDTDEADTRLVDRGVLTRLCTWEVVEEVVAGVRRYVVDLVEDDEDVPAYVFDFFVQELEDSVRAISTLRELIVGIPELVYESADESVGRFVVPAVDRAEDVKVDVLLVCFLE